MSSQNSLDQTFVMCIYPNLRACYQVAFLRLSKSIFVSTPSSYSAERAQVKSMA